MGELSFAVFPEDTMATAITTTVLVGVWVVVFFNLRFGWVLSGLVVPGYLVPLLLTKPVSAGVILMESIVTYAVVWLMSEGFRNRPHWSSFFGRDRFFALVVCSILVRVLFDGWLLPLIGPAIQNMIGGDFDYRNHFHSYGLIIVALMANGFCKPRLIRGIVQLVVTVGVTYLIVRFVLIETTNFHVGSLQYLYEDVATSLLASPKSYIILVTTAMVASRMNLRYSWDYNGILVPSLLALQWHEPLKILTSFIEAFVILMLARVVLKLPVCRRTTIEGGRKILLFFNLAFLYRLGLSYAIPALLPMVKVTDAFGFGYLLSTLIAMRAHEKNLTILVMRASLQVSLLGAVAGSLCGFALTFLPAIDMRRSSADTPVGTATPFQSDQELVALVRQDKLVLYRQRIPGNYVPPSAADLKWFEVGIRHLREYQSGKQVEALSAARQALARVNYSVQCVQQRYLYLRETSPARGWGLYALNLHNPDAVVVEIPAPLDEWSTMEAGLRLFQHLDGGALAVAGASRHLSAGGTADVLSNAVTIYGVFHRQVEQGNVLEVRGQTREHLRKFHRTDSDQPDELGRSSLWIKNAIPAGCALDRLSELLARWELHWCTSPLPNVLRDNMQRGFAELVLTRQDRRTLLASLVTDGVQGDSREGVELLDMPVRQWLIQRKEQIADRGSNQYLPPEVEQLLYLDEQVVKPILHSIRYVQRFTDLSREGQEELRALSTAAALLDYRLIICCGGEQQADCLVLEAVDGLPRRCWGTYVFRFGTAAPQLIQVPRPLYERNAYEFAVTMFERMEASALLIAGAHPSANVDGSADVIQLENKVNMFNLVHQVCLREWGPRPMLVTSVRAIRAPVDAEVVVAMSDGTRCVADASPLQRQLLDTLETDRLTFRFADGSRSTAGYEIGSSPQFGVLAQSEQKEFAYLWLSPSIRRTLREDTLEAQVETLGIPTVTADLYRYLCALPANSQLAVPADLRRVVEQFVSNRDIVCLRKLQSEYPQFRLTHLVDQSSRHAYLLIDQPSRELLPAVASLKERTERNAGTVVAGGLRRDRIQHFINSRAAWLEIEGTP